MSYTPTLMRRPESRYQKKSLVKEVSKICVVVGKVAVVL